MRFARDRGWVATRHAIDFEDDAHHVNAPARKDATVRQHTPHDDSAVRVLVLRPVAAVVDGISLDELQPGHFYDLPAGAARYVIARKAGFEVPSKSEGHDSRNLTSRP